MNPSFSGLKMLCVLRPMRLNQRWWSPVRAAAHVRDFRLVLMKDGLYSVYCFPSSFAVLFSLYSLFSRFIFGSAIIGFFVSFSNLVSFREICRETKPSIRWGSECPTRSDEGEWERERRGLRGGRISREERTAEDTSDR